MHDDTVCVGGRCVTPVSTPVMRLATLPYISQPPFKPLSCSWRQVAGTWLRGRLRVGLHLVHLPSFTRVGGPPLPLLQPFIPLPLTG